MADQVSPSSPTRTQVPEPLQRGDGAFAESLVSQPGGPLARLQGAGPASVATADGRSKRLRQELESSMGAESSSALVKAADLDGDGVVSARELQLFKMTVEAACRSAAGIAMTQRYVSGGGAIATPKSYTPRVMRAQRPAARRYALRRTFRARRTYSRRPY